MLRSFLGWLDDYMAGETPAAILRAVVGLLSFAALLGALLGSGAVKAGFLVAVLLAVTGLAILLLNDRRSLHRKYAEQLRLISRYCDFIHESTRSVPQFTSWHQTTIIDTYGNAKESMVIIAETSTDGVKFLKLRFGSGWNQPPRQRRRVRVDVRSLSTDGRQGTSVMTTSHWLPSGKLEIFAHAHQESSQIQLAIDWTWPGKCIPLMVDKVPDTFAFEFRKPVAHATQKIILPIGHDALYEPVGFAEGAAGFSIDHSVNDRGEVQLVFEARQLPADHRAGIRLELK